MSRSLHRSNAAGAYGPRNAGLGEGFVRAGLVAPLTARATRACGLEFTSAHVPLGLTARATRAFVKALYNRGGNGRGNDESI